MRTAQSQVGYCPRCGESLATSRGFVQEFWVGDETICFCWCYCCEWRGEVKQIERMIGIESNEA